MPALPSVPKAARVVLSGLIDGTKPWVNAFHYGYSVGAPLTAAEVAALATTMSTAWATNIAPSVASTLKLTQALVQALDSPSAPVGIDTTVHPGTGGAESVAAGTAFVVSREVTRRYRGGHSRIYIAGAEASALNNTERTWAPGVVTAFTTDWQNLELAGAVALVGGGHTDADSVNISYYEGFTNFLYPSGRYRARPTLRATPLVDLVVSFRGNPLACSQRRREQP